MRPRRPILVFFLLLFVALALWQSVHPRQLLKNGELTQNFDGWQTNTGISIFRDPVPHDWHFYWQAIKAGQLLHLRDLNNDHFTALGAGNTTGSVLSQTVPLDGRPARCRLSFTFAATGDAGTTAVIEVRLTDPSGDALATQNFTNTHPVKTYYVPRAQERTEHLTFDVRANTPSLTLSFADQSPNQGIAVDPLIKNVRLEKVR